MAENKFRPQIRFTRAKVACSPGSSPQAGAVSGARSEPEELGCRSPGSGRGSARVLTLNQVIPSRERLCSPARFCRATNFHTAFN